MAKVLILDKNFGGIENIVSAVSALKRKSPGLPVAVNEPALKAALSAKNIGSEIILHLLTEEEDIDIYARAEEVCRRINRYLGNEAGAMFYGMNLFDLNLLDIAYTLRHLISMDYLAEKKFSNRDWIFASMRLRFHAPYAGAYNTEILESADFVVEENRIKSELKRVKRAFFRRSTRPAAVKETSKTNIVFPKNEAGKKRILFVLTETASGIVSSSFLPLLTELKRHNEFQAVVAVNSEGASAAFRAAGIEIIFPVQELPQEIMQHMKTLTETVPVKITAKLSGLTSGSAEYNIWDNYLDYGFAGLEECYKAVTFFKTLYENFIPDVVVTSADRTVVGKAGVLMARNLGIPSMLHYPCLIRAHSWFRDCYTDAIGSYGLHNEQCIIANGLLGKQIYRIGNPKFDNMAHRDHEADKNNIYRKLNIQPGRKLVLIIGSLVVPDAAKWLSAVTKEFAQHKENNVSVWLKPHPGDVITEYELIIKENRAGKIVNLLPASLDSYELLSASDAVITDFSTFGAEAILMKIPVITVNLSGKPYCVRFEESGAAEPVTKIQEFWEKITAILSDGGIREKLTANYPKAEELYGYKIDGLATKRFIDAIKDLEEKYEEDDADVCSRRSKTTS